MKVQHLAHIVLFGISLLALTSCEKPVIRVNGLVRDRNTGYELYHVKTWMSGTTDTFDINTSFGYFCATYFPADTQDIVELNFSKEGYKTKSFLLAKNSSQQLFIYLEKDFDFSKLRPDITDTVVKIEKSNQIVDFHIGIHGRTTPLWNTQLWLMKHATVDELIHLMNYPNTAVQGVAFEGLLKKKYTGIYEILSKLSFELFPMLHFQSGCLGYNYSVGEYCYNLVRNYESELWWKNATPIFLTTEQHKEIQKLINPSDRH